MKMTKGKVFWFVVFLLVVAMIPVHYEDFTETRTTDYEFEYASVSIEVENTGELGYSVFGIEVDSNNDYTYELTFMCNETTTIIEGHPNYRAPDNLSGSYLCKPDEELTFRINNSSAWVVLTSNGVVDKISLWSLRFYL